LNPTPKELGLRLLPEPNSLEDMGSGMKPDPMLGVHPSTLVGSGAGPEPSMLGSRQFIWTRFSPLMGLSPTFARDFSETPCESLNIFY